MFLIAGTPLMAQPEAGHFSIIPKIGGSISTLSGNPEIMDYNMHYYVRDGDSYEEHSYRFCYYDAELKYRKGWSAGLEIACQFTDRLGMSFGVCYSMQGAAYKESYDIDFDNSTCYLYPGGEGPAVVLPLHTDHLHLTDISMKMECINAPLMVKFYLYKGLAVNAGYLWGYCRDTRLCYGGSVNELSFDNRKGVAELNTSDMVNGKKHELYIKTESTADSKVKKKQRGIPVSLSFEHQRLVAELGYCFYLTDAGDWSTVADMDGYLRSVPANSRNQVLTLSLGYRFDLGE